MSQRSTPTKARLSGSTQPKAPYAKAPHANASGLNVIQSGAANQLLERCQSWLNNGLSLVFPPRCVSCDRAGWFFCPHCAQRVEPVGQEICLQCGRPQLHTISRCEVCRQQAFYATNENPLIMIRVAAIHAPPLRQAIHALKYGGQTELALPLARYLVAALLDVPWADVYQSVDALIPVPLHDERRSERGYNQSELLAQAYCRLSKIPLQSNWLVRQRSTRSQVGLTATERHSNVEQAFVADPAVTGKRIILLDDVYTTGATLHACAHAVVEAGATAVYALALACPR